MSEATSPAKRAAKSSTPVPYAWSTAADPADTFVIATWNVNLAAHAPRAPAHLACRAQA